jgi:hypothetical protein
MVIFVINFPGYSNKCNFQYPLGETIGEISLLGGCRLSKNALGARGHPGTHGDKLAGQTDQYTNGLCAWVALAGLPSQLIGNR